VKQVRLGVLVLLLGLALVVSAFAAGTKETGKAMGPVKIALLVKNLGNPFFDAVDTGGKEAAKELGNIDVIYQ
jgi:rhamnose transport system substrate-binding protein